jgi:hypothetical protein
MRMWIAASHELTLVLKDLDVVDIRPSAKLFILLRPDTNDLPDIGTIHFGKREVMPGRKTDNTAYSRLRLSNKQVPFGMLSLRDGRNQSTEIVRKDKRG